MKMYKVYKVSGITLFVEKWTYKGLLVDMLFHKYYVEFNIKCLNFDLYIKIGKSK